MRRALVLALVLSGCATGAPRRDAPSPAAYPTGVSLPPGISHIERTARYEIIGDDAMALRRAMRERGPLGSNGRSFDGRTDWNARWTYRSEARAGRCRTGDVRLALTVTIIMPLWTAPDTATPLAREWTAFIGALKRHEQGHRDIAVRGAAEVARAVRDAETMTCALLGNEVRRLAQAAIERVRKRQETYDLETRHGATEGAVWPPASLRRPAPNTPPRPS